MYATFNNTRIIMRFCSLLQALEERKSNAVLVEKSEKEMDALREDLNGQISRLRADHDEKVQNLESRLEVALGKACLTSST